MLKEHPFKIDNIVIPFPKTWEESLRTVENTYITEDGHKDKSIVRDGILNVRCSIQCIDTLAAALEVISKKDSVVLTRYNIETKQYETKDMWINDFKKVLVEQSWKLSKTDGVWIVSFGMEEV